MKFKNIKSLIKTKSIIKYLKIFFRIFLIYFFSMIIFSLMFPKRLFFVDNLRLNIQSKLLIFAWTYNSQWYNKILEKELVYISKKLKPWDLLFTHSKWYNISNTLIPWKRTHFLMYIWTRKEVLKFVWEENELFEIIDQYYENEDDILIIDSDKHGVGIKNINTLEHLDAILGIRMNIPSFTKKMFFEHILTQLDKDYDFDFVLDHDDEIFCAELLYNWLNSIGMNLPTKEIYIREIISPNGIVKYIINQWIPENKFSFILFLDDIQTETKYYTYNVLEKQMKED